jgi:hypothetical protein
MTTKSNLQRYLVSATYLTELSKSPYPHEYPRIMGYYDTETPEKAFEKFLHDHAPTIRRAQIFYDDVMVIPVPATGFKYQLSAVYGQLAKFPNTEALEEFGR